MSDHTPLTLIIEIQVLQKKKVTVRQDFRYE